MRFELTYANGSKVQVEIPDKDLVEILDQKAKAQAAEISNKSELSRGSATSCKVV